MSAFDPKRTSETADCLLKLNHLVGGVLHIPWNPPTSFMGLVRTAAAENSNIERVLAVSVRDQRSTFLYAKAATTFVRSKKLIDSLCLLTLDFICSAPDIWDFTGQGACMGVGDCEVLSRSRLTGGECVPQAQKTPRGSEFIDRPICPKCGSQMWLARVTPEGSERENRAFECPVCDISETLCPLSSGAKP
jgi:hypothetical protein